MSNVESFEINLEHDIDEQYQYEPGETIRGHLLLKLTNAIKVNAITVQIKGEANVSWEDEKIKPYRADEIFIELNQNLVQAQPGDSKSFDRGKHRFPFEYDLPKNLPSSFIGKFGSITYVIKATLKEDKKFGLSTLITSEPFLVLRKLDLELDAALQKPYEVKLVKRFWGALAFCISGKVTIDLKINKTGHLPGEDIFMDAEISNGSPRIVKAMQASIVMHSTFHAQNNTKYNMQMVNKKRDEWEMSYGEGRRWKGVRLTIPPYIPESRLDGCDIIDIRYELIFRLDISGGNEMRLVIPLTVGTWAGEEGVPRARIKSSMPNGDTYIKAPGAERAKDDDDDYEDNNNEGAAADEIELDDVESEQFRYPMQPGETRRNPLFAT